MDLFLHKDVVEGELILEVEQMLYDFSKDTEVAREKYINIQIYDVFGQLGSILDTCYLETEWSGSSSDDSPYEFNKFIETCLME